jgi:hypothetical protein
VVFDGGHSESRGPGRADPVRGRPPPGPRGSSRPPAMRRWAWRLSAMR